MYSRAEQQRIHDLQEQINPLEDWIRANQYTDPTDEMTDKRRELMKLLFELNDTLDQKHLKAAQSQS